VAEGGETHLPPSGPPPSQIQSAPNLVGFDPKAVVPSQTLYLQRNDFLAFFGLSNVAGVTVQINYRLLTPQGEIKEGQFNSAPSAPNLAFSFSLYEGWLLSFAVRITSAVAQGQWLFLQAFVSRAVTPTSDGIIQSVFWQSYVPGFTPVGWPGSPSMGVSDGQGTLRSITGTTPAAGAEINEVVPANRRWALIAIRAILTASATVANRFPSYNIDDGVNTFWQVHTSVAQTAGQGVLYEGASGQTFFNDTQGSLVIPLPTPLPLKTSFRIRTITGGIQAGDQWTAPQYLVQEWGLWDS
jgi:hypothetical protein